MSDTTDFWRQVRAVAKEVVDNALERTTGITPGVHGGVTFDRFGRALHGGGLGIVGVYQVQASINVPGGTAYRVNWGSVIHDPGSVVTTGTAWTFQPRGFPGTAWYFVASMLEVGKPAGVTWGSVTGADLEIYKNGAYYVDMTRRKLEVSVATNGYKMTLNGAAAVPLGTADTMYVTLAHDLGTAGGSPVIGEASTHAHLTIIRIG